MSEEQRTRPTFYHFSSVDGGGALILNLNDVIAVKNHNPGTLNIRYRTGDLNHPIHELIVAGELDEMAKELQAKDWPKIEKEVRAKNGSRNIASPFSI